MSTVFWTHHCGECKKPVEADAMLSRHNDRDGGHQLTGNIPAHFGQMLPKCRHTAQNDWSEKPLIRDFLCCG